MRQSRIYHAAFAVPMMVFVLLSAAGVAQERPSRRVFRESVSVTTDSQVVKRLGTAQDHLAGQQWDEAVPILQQIIETRGNTMLPLETGRYGNAADFCHLLISRLSPDGLAAYRRRVDPQAAEWLDQAEASLDPALFQRVLSVAFNSSSGDDALWRLGSLAFEQGRFAAARQHWQQLVPPVRADEDEKEAAALPYLTYPDSSFEPAAVRARLILCTIFEGDGERAERELDVFERYHSLAEGTLTGQSGRLSDILRNTLKESRDWWLGRVIPDEMMTFAGRPDRNPMPVKEHSPGRQRWTRRLPEIQFSGQSPPALRGPQWQMRFHPVVYRDTIYLCTSHSIFALDLATGQSARWPGDPVPAAGKISRTGVPAEAVSKTGLDGSQRTVMLDADTEDTRIFTNSTEESFRIIRDPIGITRYTLTIADGRLYARMGPPISRRSPHEGSAISEIVGLDIETGQGLLVFRVTSDILDADAASPEATAWSFEGTPLVANGRVYVSARRGTPEDEIAVACFDAASSQLLWQQRICSNLNTVFDRSSLLDHRLLTLGDGRLFLTTGTGAIASLDAETGKLLWVVTYDNGARTADRRTTFLDESNHPARNGLLPCVYHRGTVYAAAPDANRLFALDATTGQLVWQSEQAAGEWLRHLLGVVGDRLIACGNQLVAFDIHTGATAWRISHPNPDAWTHGRGILTDRSVYWPLRNEIVRVSIRSGEIQRRFQLTKSDGLQGGHLLIVGDRMLVVAHDRISVLRNLDVPPPAATDGPVGALPLDDATHSSLEEALRRARAAEELFRPDVASALFRSAQQRAVAPQLTAEQRQYGSHVAARGLVRSNLALAGVSPGPARAAYLQTVWQTVRAHPKAFSAEEHIQALLDLCANESDGHRLQKTAEQFLKESEFAREAWLRPLFWGDPVQETVAEAVRQTISGRPVDSSRFPPAESANHAATTEGPRRLLRRVWTRKIRADSLVLMPTDAAAPGLKFLIQDKELTGVDAESGHLAWQTPVAGVFEQAARVPLGNSKVGLLLLGTSEAHLRDADSGRHRWSQRWPQTVRFEIVSQASRTDDDSALLCIDSSRVTALNIQTGQRLWSFPPEHQAAGPTDSGRLGSPSTFLRMGQKAVFLASHSADAFLLDLRTGFPLARIPDADLPAAGQWIPTATEDAGLAASIWKSSRLRIQSFGGQGTSRLAKRKLGIGLHRPVLLTDQPPFTLLIENGLMAERINVTSAQPAWRIRFDSPVENPGHMIKLTRDAFFVASSGVLKRIQLENGNVKWHQRLGEGTWWIPQTHGRLILAAGSWPDKHGKHQSEVVLCETRSGRPVQRVRFPGKIHFGDVHCGGDVVLVRCGTTLHGLVAGGRPVSAPARSGNRGPATPHGDQAAFEF